MEEQNQIQEKETTEQKVTPVPPVQQGGYGMPVPPVQQSGYGTPVPPVQQSGYGTPVPPVQQGGYGTPVLPVQQGGYGTPVPPVQQGGCGTPVLPVQQTVPQPIPPTPPMRYGVMSDYGHMGEMKEVSDGLAIASMVLGIVSILACTWFYIAIPCAIVGLVLGCVYRSKGGKSGMSVAGIACSGAGLALGILIGFVLLVDIWMYW